MFSSASDLKMIYQVFCEIDRDDSGRVRLREFKTYVQHNTPQLLAVATSLFNKADIHKQGRISFAQLMRALFPSTSHDDLRSMIDTARPFQKEKKTKLDPEMMEDITEIFRQCRSHLYPSRLPIHAFRVYDDNGDNTLDRDEFFSAIMTLGWSESEVEQIFAEIDKDNNGVVSLEEFIDWFAERGRHPISQEDASSESD